MTSAKLKGSLLEYCIRRILSNCGFTKVKPDNLLIFNRGDLTMINGKGAAHDADVLMNPPIQMPFSYPFRLNFECKSYDRKIGLSIIRNALGLRYDLNEFEIVTRNQLINRQNNRRATIAIDNRQRFNYQVGVATVEDFTKPAFEFAANNKIPLISLRWFLPSNICDYFHQITNQYIGQFNSQELDNLNAFLKGNGNSQGQRFIENTDSLFRNIYRAIDEFEENVVIGILESGDMLFLIAQNGAEDIEYLRRQNIDLTSQFHYYRRELDYWELSINNERRFGFYLPLNIMEMWRSREFRTDEALSIKRRLFSKMYVFVRNGEYPFRILNIDQEWLGTFNGN